MTPPQDRNSDRELGALTEAINGVRREMERDRELGDTRHEENTDKLDQVLGLKPMVEAHDAWIKGPGAEVARILTEARGAGKLTKFVYTAVGIIGGGAAYKALAAVLAALPK